MGVGEGVGGTHTMVGGGRSLMFVWNVRLQWRGVCHPPVRQVECEWVCGWVDAWWAVCCGICAVQWWAQDCVCACGWESLWVGGECVVGGGFNDGDRIHLRHSTLCVAHSS
jgi:hypothetical protein